MNIGFFTDGYLPQLNGVATSVEAWTRELDQLGHNVYIIAPKYPNFEDKRNVIRITSMRVWRKPEIRIGVFPSPRAIAKISKLDLDIIHGLSGGSISTLGLIVARLKKIPFVFTYYTRWNRYTHYILKGKLVSEKTVESISRIFCNKCDYITVPVLKIKHELVSFGVKKPITVIPSGVNLKQFANHKKGHLRKITGIKDGDILLHVGRLGKEKRVDFLLKAFQLISKKKPKTNLVLIGDGPDKERLKNISEKLNIKKRVYFVGEIDYWEMNKAYTDASLFVFASTTETQGLVILEALASGLLVVTVRDEVFDGILEDNINSVLVDNDKEQFAEACLTILNNDMYRKKLSKNAYKTALKFSVEKTARDFENLYYRVIHKKFR